MTCVGMPSSISVSDSSGRGANPLCLPPTGFCGCSGGGFADTLASAAFGGSLLCSLSLSPILSCMARERGSDDLRTGSRGLILTLDTRDVYVVPLATVQASVVPILRLERAFRGLGGGSGSLESCFVCAFSAGEGFCDFVL